MSASMVNYIFKTLGHNEHNIDVLFKWAKRQTRLDKLIVMNIVIQTGSLIWLIHRLGKAETKIEQLEAQLFEQQFVEEYETGDE